MTNAWQLNSLSHHSLMVVQYLQNQTSNVSHFRITWMFYHILLYSQGSCLIRTFIATHFQFWYKEKRTYMTHCFFFCPGNYMTPPVILSLYNRQIRLHMEYRRHPCWSFSVLILQLWENRLRGFPVWWTISHSTILFSKENNIRLLLFYRDLPGKSSNEQHSLAPLGLYIYYQYSSYH